MVEGEHVVGILTELDLSAGTWKGVDMHAELARFLTLSAAVLAAAAFVSASVNRSGVHRVSDRVAIGPADAGRGTALAAEGFNGIVNLREEAEFNDGPLSHAARDSGMQFVRVPL